MLTHPGLKLNIGEPVLANERELIPVRKLGEGGVGQAWLVREGQSREMVLKVLGGGDRNQLAPLARAAIERSINIQNTRIPADRGVRIQKAVSELGGNTILYDFIPGKTLWEIRKEGLGIEERIELVRSEASALIGSCIGFGELGIAHNDISLKNIVITDRNPVGERGVLIDCDFMSEIDTRIDGEAFHPHGPVWFTAPEVLEKKRPSFASDIFALGVTLITFLSERMGSAPSPVQLSEERLLYGFKEAPSTSQVLGKTVEVASEVDPNLVDLLLQLVHCVPEVRVDGIRERIKSIDENRAPILAVSSNNRQGI